jgi:Domain of unknown function (DUF5597)
MLATLFNSLPLMLGGELHNSSSSAPAHVEAHVWDRLLSLNCDTVLAPITWQQMQPAPGQFDFTVTDALVNGARGRGLRLVPLWFGAYKNTWSSYAPDWVKRDQARFPRAEIVPGRPSGQLSVFSEEVVIADAAAFAALMRHIRDLDPDRKVIPLVQVENEVGILCPTARDRSAAADAAWAGPVPQTLVSSLRKRRDRLQPRLGDLWDAHGARESGTWGEVFGDTIGGAEVFMAWHFAHFVETVSSAGRREHEVPMFVNAWLVQHADQMPGAYPSGGPVAHMIDVWQAGAPGLCLAADIYVDDFSGVTAEYAAANAAFGLPLLLPEIRGDIAMAAKAFLSVGQSGAKLYAPFGIDSVPLPKETDAIAGEAGGPSANPVADAGPCVRATPLAARLLAETYEAIRGLGDRLRIARSAGLATTVLQNRESPLRQERTLGGWRLNITFGQPYSAADPPAAGIVIIRLDPDDSNVVEMEVAGYGFDLAFARPGENEAGNYVEWLEVWEGAYSEGGRGPWQAGRCLNGDELGIRLPMKTVCCRRARAHALQSPGPLMADPILLPVKVSVAARKGGGVRKSPAGAKSKVVSKI